VSILQSDPAVVHAAPDDTPPVAPPLTEGQPVEAVTQQAWEKDSWTEDEVYEWIAASMHDAARESGGGW
jgi:hypothetical protein